MAAFAADVEKFHSRIVASLLRLEEHGFLVGTDRTWLIRSWKRRVGANVLCDTGCLAGRVVEVVAEDARRLGVFGELAGSAGKLQLEVALILLGVQHVGALRAESEGHLLELLRLGRLGGGGLRRRHVDRLSRSAVAGGEGGGGKVKSCVREVWAETAFV